MKVATLVCSNVPLGREAKLSKEYSKLLNERLPDGLERTFLMKNSDEPGSYTIDSIWRNREALEAMRSKGRPKAIEPFESVGSQPRVLIFYIEAEYP